MTHRQLLTACSLLCLTGCDGGTSKATPTPFALAKSDEPRATDPAVSSDTAARFGADNRGFAFDLYARLATPDHNLLIAPFSVSVGLAMTYAGAKGTTADEMASALHFTLPQAMLHAAFNATLLDLDQRAGDVPDNESGTGFELGIVDQAFGQQDFTFLDSYLDVLAINYGAGMGLVDFANVDATRKVINDWVSEQTQERIPELLPAGAIGGETRLLLANAIDFKASWHKPFDPDQTTPATFQAPDGDRKVQMMHALDTLAYSAQASYQAIELPYLSRAVRMLLILPAEGEFESVLHGLNGELFDEVRADLSTYIVTLSLPRYRFESATQLKAPLQDLGMNAAFADADFSGMARSHLSVADIYHDAFIAVDEEGTEAAAATAVVINRDGGISEYPQAELTFDRPFIFAIYDSTTEQLLFLGQLVDPQ